MAKYEVTIINGKEYWVRTSDDGVPMIIGDPQKDQAEAIAKAMESGSSITDDLHKHFVEEDKPVFNYPTGDINDLTNMDRLSPTEEIVNQMRKNGNYDKDPRFGAPRYYEGTTVPTEEYVMYMHNKSIQDTNYCRKLEHKRKLINGLIIGLGIAIPATLILGYILFKTIQMI